jgi:hypothetical protein
VAGKFQIRSRRWDVGICVASLVGLVLAFGGLLVLQLAGNATGTPTLLFVVVLGLLTFAAFAGPGIVYVVRKRVKPVKDRLPGGTMTWIRSHLYLPVLALVLAVGHAAAVPFRGHLSSGKVLLALGVLVSVAGLARHHLIGIQKAALNVNVAIGKLTTGQPRAFRRLVADYTDHRRSREEIDAAVAAMEPSVQATWKKITDLATSVERHFPHDGGQRWHIRQYKLWRALHPPLTIALFVVLAFHVWDVFGGTRAVGGDEEAFATAGECAGCHSDTFQEWAGSTMAHAQTSSINEAQLPVTLAENLRIVDEFDDSASLALLAGRDLDVDSQQELVDDTAHVCVDCHAPVGGSFADDPLELLPFGEGASTVSGNAAVTADGIGCIVCHTQEVPPGEGQGNDPLVGGAVDGEASLGSYGTMYGPPFTDPNPLPVRVHGVETPDEDGFWRDDVETSQLCGACHNVKLDIDGDGLSDVDDAEEQGILDIIDDADELDADGDFVLDENELDDDRVQTTAGTPAGDQDDGGDGFIDDLVLQTTYDEWQDYVAFFDTDGGFDDRYAAATFPNELSAPLGCSSCHMPFGDDIEGPVVDEAPGLLPVPDRVRRQHTFIGVDYDLDPQLYRDAGLSDDDIARVVAERDALIQSSATLQVVLGDVVDFPTGPALPVQVVVRNNLLAHAFPTGFAFARQFWIEVSAETVGGEPVCLTAGFFDENGAPLGNAPCGSGFADAAGTEAVEGDADLRQCDTRAVAEDLLGLDPDVMQANGGVDDVTGIPLPNLDIVFAPGAAFGPEECDPFLANFQKILTDGDPDGDGVRQEVPYQPLLPDAVKVRGQVATAQLMFELQPVRLRDGVDASSLAVPYFFDLSSGVDPADVLVTARLRFRHVPPYFVRDLEARQEDLGDGVPEGARIDADALLERLVVGEVVDATSGEGEELACEGPQNEATTILDCVGQADIDDAAARLGLADGTSGDDRRRVEREDGLGTTGGIVSLALAGMVVPVAWWRRRRTRACTATAGGRSGSPAGRRWPCSSSSPSSADARTTTTTPGHHPRRSRPVTSRRFRTTSSNGSSPSTLGSSPCASPWSSATCARASSPPPSDTPRRPPCGPRRSTTAPGPCATWAGPPPCWGRPRPARACWSRAWRSIPTIPTACTSWAGCASSCSSVPSWPSSPSSSSSGWRWTTSSAASSTSCWRRCG